MGHPFLELDHLLAMLAVGMWAYQLGGAALWKAPLVFVLTMLVGAHLGLAGISLGLALIEPMIATSLMVLGLVIAMRLRVMPLLASMIVAVFALFHGFAHGVEMPLAASPFAYVAGLSLATILLHVMGAALAYGLHQSSQFVLVRAGGGWPGGDRSIAIGWYMS